MLCFEVVLVGSDHFAALSEFILYINPIVN